VVGNPANGLGIHDDFPVSDQIRDVFAYGFTFVAHLKAPPLIESDAPTFELHDQRVLIELLVQAVSRFVEHLERAANNGVSFLLARVGIASPGIQVEKIICVHLS